MFSIEWTISDAEWDKGRREAANHQRGSAYDRRALALYRLLYGSLDLVNDGVHFYGAAYGPAGIRVSLFDVAVALADAYMHGELEPGSSAVYKQSDDSLEMRFVADGEQVRITANDRPSALVVSRSAFTAGLVVFLCGFGKAVAEQLPGVLEWDSLTPLRAALARCSDT
jgi:hypothetical protein